MVNCTMAVLAARSDLEDAEAACGKPCEHDDCRDCPHGVERGRQITCGQWIRKEAARRRVRDLMEGRAGIKEEVLDAPLADLEEHGVSPAVIERLEKASGGFYVRDLLAMESLDAVPRLPGWQRKRVMRGLAELMKGDGR